MKEIFYGTSKGYTTDFKISFIYACVYLANGNFSRAFCLNQLGWSTLGVGMQHDGGGGGCKTHYSSPVPQNEVQIWALLQLWSIFLFRKIKFVIMVGHCVQGRPAPFLTFLDYIKSETSTANIVFKSSVNFTACVFCSFLELSLLWVCYKSVCALHLRYVKIRHKSAMPHFFKLLRIKTFSITFFCLTFCETVNLFLRQQLKGNLKAEFLVFRLIHYIKNKNHKLELTREVPVLSKVQFFYNGRFYLQNAENVINPKLNLVQRHEVQWKAAVKSTQLCCLLKSCEIPKEIQGYKEIQPKR